MEQDNNHYINVRHAQSGETALSIKNLRLDLPDGKTTLINDFNLALKKGDRLILTGPSGSGKSTLAKAILNLWDYGEGDISLPVDCKIMAVSQKAYFSNTSVRGLLNAPRKEGHFDDAALSQVLKAVGHDKLIQHIPGQQVQIMMDDLLADIPNILTPYAGEELSAPQIKKMGKDILDRVNVLVREQFDFVQYIPEAQKEYLGSKLGDVMNASFEKPLSAEDVSALTGQIIDAINQALTRPLYNGLLDRAVETAKRYAPKNSTKMAYFSWNLHRSLEKAVKTYMANEDTDDLSREIQINEQQAKFITSELSSAIDQRLKDEHCKKGILRSLFNVVTWPIALLTMPLKARNTSKEIVQDLTVFMEGQNVTGDKLSGQLSGGEQQKLTFARILLHQPDILILDEITAALDMPTGDELYEEMVTKLPDTIMVSIAHNTHIMKHHTHHANLDAETKKITVRPIQP